MTERSLEGEPKYCPGRQRACALPVLSGRRGRATKEGKSAYGSSVTRRVTFALGPSAFPVSSWKEQPETKLRLVDAHFLSIPFQGEELANVKHTSWQNQM